MNWIFDGIGSTIIGTVLGVLLGGAAGGFIGYKIGMKNKIKQSQKAKNNSTQVQIGSFTTINTNGDMNKNE